MIVSDLNSYLAGGIAWKIVFFHGDIGCDFVVFLKFDLTGLLRLQKKHTINIVILILPFNDDLLTTNLPQIDELFEAFIGQDCIQPVIASVGATGSTHSIFLLRVLSWNALFLRLQRFLFSVIESLSV